MFEGQWGIRLLVKKSDIYIKTVYTYRFYIMYLMKDVTHPAIWIFLSSWVWNVESEIYVFIIYMFDVTDTIINAIFMNHKYTSLLEGLKIQLNILWYKHQVGAVTWSLFETRK